MSDRAIREAVQILAGTKLTDKVDLLVATVVSVDEGSRSCVCDVIAGKAAYRLTDVRLMNTVDDGFLIIPEIGSNVTVIKSDYIAPFVAQYSSVDKIILRGGDLGGLVKVISTVQRLNLIEDKINSLLTAYNAHMHSANNTPTLSTVSGNLVKTNRGDIENENITQG